MSTETQTLVPRKTLAAGAASVLDVVRRTAEPVPGPEGDGVRWRTISYEGQPHYSNRLYDGAAGIGLFLADYATVTGDPTARDLAQRALRWSAAPAQEEASRARPFRGPGMEFSLLVGRAGLGLAWLHLARAVGEGAPLAAARAIGDELVAREPGPFTYLLSGAAGEGLLLLRLWDATGDARYLDGAARYAAWLERQAVRDALGCTWRARDATAVPPPGTRFAGGGDPPSRYLGLGIGVAGVTHFLTLLYGATRDARWETLAREGADTLLRLALPDHGGLNWESEPLEGAESKLRCQWCRGAAGVGLCLALCYEVMGDPRYLKTAEAAGETTYRYGDVRANPSLCHGLGGNAALFVALHRATRRSTWLERAHAFAARALTYRTATPAGAVWQADAPDSTSPDLMCGAAGVGHFLLHLLEPERVHLPFLWPGAPAAGDGVRTEGVPQ
jgi:lantibiotic modifying enzyme